MPDLKTLASSLFKLVFGWYLLLAILVTCVQLGLEYSAIRATISTDLAALGRSFAAGVSDALWTYDKSMLDSLVRGIAQTAIVTGVKIEDSRGDIVATEGRIPSENEPASGNMLAPFQRHDVPLWSVALAESHGKRALGKMVLYSDREVVVDRIRYSFLVILINSLVKTAGLWLIFYWAITWRLSRPLTQLSNAVSNLDLKADEDEPVLLDYPHMDEIGMLVASLNEMRIRLSASHRELEQKVAERTRELCAAKESAEATNEILQASKERIEAAALAGIIGVWEWDVVNDRLIWDKVMYMLYGRKESDFGGAYEAWASALHPEDRASTEREIQAALSREREYAPEFRVIWPDGSIHFLKARSRTTYDDQGKPLRMIGVNYDLTEQKRIEQALQREVEKSLSLLRNASDGIHILDTDGNLIEASDSFFEMLGYSREELIGKNASLWYKHFDSPNPLDVVKQLFLCPGRSQFEVHHRRKGGSIIDVEVSSCPLVFGDKQVLFNSSRDITERKQAESEILRSNAELEKFSYAISHDMRQPLRMIVSYLQLLESGIIDQLDGEQREYFNFAIGGAKRLDQMMIGLLEYSRLGRKGEPPAWINSRAVLDEALSFLQPAIAEAQADVRIQGNWPRILVSPDEMLRLMQNLISNALKFRVAGRSPEIIVTSAKTDKEWCFSVADNGVGIIPDQIGRLFQVFQRLQSLATYEGTGIGLALCRKISEHHGGRIWAESAGEGQGSRFCVALPQEKSEQQV